VPFLVIDIIQKLLYAKFKINPPRLVTVANIKTRMRFQIVYDYTHCDKMASLMFECILQPNLYDSV